MATARRFGMRSTPGVHGSRKSFRVQNSRITSPRCAPTPKAVGRWTMSNSAQGGGPDLAASSLPERLRSSDLESVNEALAGLFADLRYASRLYTEKDLSDRA